MTILVLASQCSLTPAYFTKPIIPWPQLTQPLELREGHAGEGLSLTFSR